MNRLRSWASSLAALSAVFLGQNYPRGLGGNAYQNELASNGPFQFFAAFRNNELDYPQFYASLPGEQIAGLLRDEVSEPNARFLGSDPQDIRRVIDNPGQPRRLNVILVTIESLSARYLGSFGDKHGLTPNLPADKHETLVQPKVGHYGVFNGSRFRNEIYPAIRAFIRRNER